MNISVTHLLNLMGQLFIISVVGTNLAWSQDERFFRELFTPEEKKEEKIKAEFHDQTSDLYEIDLNGDGRNESFLVRMVDGIQYLYLYDYLNKDVLFTYKLDSYGHKARIYKVSAHQLSEDTKVLLISFFEGYTEYLDFNAYSRLYFLTYQNNDLKTLSMYKGPRFHEEAESYRKKYHRKSYQISLQDINKDGIKDILLKYHLISKLFLFNSDGKWVEI